MALVDGSAQQLVIERARAEPHHHQARHGKLITKRERLEHRSNLPRRRNHLAALVHGALASMQLMRFDDHSSLFIHASASSEAGMSWLASGGQ